MISWTSFGWSVSKVAPKCLCRHQSGRAVNLRGVVFCDNLQVSQFILDDCIERGEGSTCRIVCTQPRRISAISVRHSSAHYAMFS